MEKTIMIPRMNIQYGSAKNLLVAAAVCVFGAQAGVANAASAKTMTVQVKSAQLKDAPSFTARAAGAVEYGERVTVIEERGAWSKITTGGGASGWVHSSALTVKRLELKAGGGDMAMGASADEVATAGKGFNTQVEAEFRRKNSKIDFKWVDRMSKITVSAEEVRAFLLEGGLGEGGAQ